jgi:hypothetical protein
MPLPYRYKSIPSSSTNSVLVGARGGAIGDRIDKLLCIVTATATSQVQIKDGSGTAFTVLPNNVAAVGTHTVELGIESVLGAWQITTAAGVAVVAIGAFT